MWVQCLRVAQTTTIFFCIVKLLLWDNYRQLVFMAQIKLSCYGSLTFPTIVANSFLFLSISSLFSAIDPYYQQLNSEKKTRDWWSMSVWLFVCCWAIALDRDTWKKKKRAFTEVKIDSGKAALGVLIIVGDFVLLYLISCYSNDCIFFSLYS